MFDERYQIDKSKIRASFDQAATQYDEAAVLQREIGERLLERLDVVKLEPRRVLDIGAGTGRLTRQLADRYSKARVIALDLAPAMLAQARSHVSWFSKQEFVCADAEFLPLADDSVDMVFSNLTFQWCQDLDRALCEAFRVLKPGGLLMFTTLGPDTLRELRDSWSVADGYNHVNAFVDMHDIGDALVRARYADPVIDVEKLTLNYHNVFQLMRDLKRLGAHNLTGGRPRGLTGKQRLLAMQEAYESYRVREMLPATYEVVYGHAWAPPAKPAGHHDETGAFRFPVHQLLKKK